MKKSLTFIYIFAAFCVMLTISAYASYIDPSAVTYTAQAIAAVVVALGALITVFRHKIVALFKKNKEETSKREIHVIEDDSAEPNKEQAENTAEEVAEVTVGEQQQ